MGNIADLSQGFTRLRAEMDRLVVGHDDVKTALLLSLICREHIYLEGPTGCAKTMLAEIAARATGLKFFFYQMHRDSRISEILGEQIITRRAVAGGEIVAPQILRGGLLKCQVAVLDDISRAPGESLNVLLRILNERAFGPQDIPLNTAVATSNPTANEYYNEPLDPATLDRFLFQIKVRGLLHQGDWPRAADLLRMYREDLDGQAVAVSLSKGFLDLAYQTLSEIKISDNWLRAYLKFWRELTSTHYPEDFRPLISDRTFLVKSIKAFKAHALINGRAEVTQEDISALKYIIAFRLPEIVPAKLDQKFEDIYQPQGAKTEEMQPESGSQEAFSETNDDGSISPILGDDRDIEPLLAEMRQATGRKQKKTGQKAQRSKEEDAPAIAYDPEAKDPPHLKDNYFAVHEELEVMSEGRQTARNLDELLVILKGRLQKRVTEKREHVGGVPRRYRPMKDLDELENMHPADAHIWLETPHPPFPRVLKKERPSEGGHIAILRDISASMTGNNSRWAETLVRGIIKIARAKKMILGYLEFNHRSFPRGRSQRFFTRDYPGILHQAEISKCFGMTNYERALTDVLSEFPPKGKDDKHIIFITDGRPSTGDLMVKKPRFLARNRGVCIHCIYIGSHDYPEILKLLARDTNGSLFTVTRKTPHSLYLNRIRDN